MIPLGTMGQWDTWDTFVKTFFNNQHSQTARLRQTSHICS